MAWFSKLHAFCMQILQIVAQSQIAELYLGVNENSQMLFSLSSGHLFR